MKFLICTLVLMQSSFALAQKSTDAENCLKSVCVGDTVFLDTSTPSMRTFWHASLAGGTVVDIDQSQEIFKIETNDKYRSKSVAKFGEIAITSGCLNDVCIGDNVEVVDALHTTGGRVIAINLLTERFILASRNLPDQWLKRVNYNLLKK